MTHVCWSRRNPINARRRLTVSMDIMYTVGHWRAIISPFKTVCFRALLWLRPVNFDLLTSLSLCHYVMLLIHLVYLADT